MLQSVTLDTATESIVMSDEEGNWVKVERGTGETVATITMGSSQGEVQVFDLDPMQALALTLELGLTV